LLAGSGDPIYGLEVAKAMQLDAAFIERANSIRKNLMNINLELLTTKKSRYNTKIYMDKCLICDGKAEHTHHIDFQCTANQHNFINHYHKNIDANLVPLCQPCHIKVHNPVDGKQYNIKGYIETSNGRKLEFHEHEVPDVSITNAKAGPVTIIKTTKIIPKILKKI
jgi:hypothetical protein